MSERSGWGWLSRCIDDWITWFLAIVWRWILWFLLRSVCVRVLFFWLVIRSAYKLHAWIFHYLRHAHYLARVWIGIWREQVSQATVDRLVVRVSTAVCLSSKHCHNGKGNFSWVPVYIRSRVSTVVSISITIASLGGYDMCATSSFFNWSNLFSVPDACISHLRTLQNIKWPEHFADSFKECEVVRDSDESVLDDGVVHELLVPYCDT